MGRRGRDVLIGVLAGEVHHVGWSAWEGFLLLPVVLGRVLASQGRTVWGQGRRALRISTLRSTLIMRLVTTVVNSQQCITFIKEKPREVDAH